MPITLLAAFGNDLYKFPHPLVSQNAEIDDWLLGLPALVKNAKIYFFDEATNALDGDDERAIMQTLVTELPDKTILFIMNRGATLAYVNRAMLLEKGRLLAFDRVAALQGVDSRFRSLFNLGTVDDEV